jgi:hypothetical protein
MSDEKKDNVLTREEMKNTKGGLASAQSIEKDPKLKDASVESVSLDESLKR